MAVVTKYVVVRNGVELDRVFTVKKEAEAYDKMLDAAEELAQLIRGGGLELDIAPAAVDAIAVHLAQNGPEVLKILKGVRPVAAFDESQDSTAADAAPPDEAQTPARQPKARSKKT